MRFVVGEDQPTFGRFDVDLYPDSHASLLEPASKQAQKSDGLPLGKVGLAENLVDREAARRARATWLRPCCSAYRERDTIGRSVGGLRLDGGRLRCFGSAPVGTRQLRVTVKSGKKT